MNVYGSSVGRQPPTTLAKDLLHYCVISLHDADLVSALTQYLDRQYDRRHWYSWTLLMMMTQSVQLVRRARLISGQRVALDGGIFFDVDGGNVEASKAREEVSLLVGAHVLDRWRGKPREAPIVLPNVMNLKPRAGDVMGTLLKEIVLAIATQNRERPW
ncbi:uncharacterized protein B0I36DRAFT_356164 [Microdochium trichocladiopsis]|uniref:Uncharacterized protein n=1 Tax=Microdochium trichocladiopsis TaxID=1682393 RepID=A0A9P8XQE8_9PEZI|nr:uncharacterized protein B0I36DRAFT_356164 [Microdochium trichocladiopsis]KAH7012066.1 hypothetical protein B0I36DRAFT_356164 [Microdochium trichocladiopsis]